MTETLDKQMIGRYVECVSAHEYLPIHTLPLCERLPEDQMVQMVKAGRLTHIMYVKDNRIYVGWWDSVDFQWFFDCYGT